MDFLDVEGVTYNVMDTAHKYPLKDMSIYFWLNETELRKINFKFIENSISKDSFLNEQIQKKYFKLSVAFYKKSRNTDYLIKSRSSKNLSLCNDDLVVEYLWTDGKPSDTLYYKNGEIEGSERIILHDIKNP